LTKVTLDSHRPPGRDARTAIEVLDDPCSMLLLCDVIFSNRHQFRELPQGSEAASTHLRAGFEIASAE